MPDIERKRCKDWLINHDDRPSRSIAIILIVKIGRQYSRSLHLRLKMTVKESTYARDQRAERWAGLQPMSSVGQSEIVRTPQIREIFSLESQRLWLGRHNIDINVIASAVSQLTKICATKGSKTWISDCRTVQETAGGGQHDHQGTANRQKQDPVTAVCICICYIAVSPPPVERGQKDASTSMRLFCFVWLLGKKCRETAHLKRKAGPGHLYGSSIPGIGKVGNTNVPKCMYYFQSGGLLWIMAIGLGYNQQLQLGVIGVSVTTSSTELPGETATERSLTLPTMHSCCDG